MVETQGDIRPAGNNPAIYNAIHKALVSGFSPSDPTREVGTLLMFSGGLDSTALLANILTATKHKLHVHYIEIHNVENRAEAEKNSVYEIIEYCKKNYRNFTFSTSKHEFHIGIGGGLDMSLALFTAGRVYNANQGGLDIVWTGHIDPSTWEIVEGAAILHASFINKLRVPEWLRPLSKMTKKDIYESIPEDLAKLSWSCRTPLYQNGYYSPCGECYTCKSISLAGGVIDDQGGGIQKRTSKIGNLPMRNQGIIHEG